MSDSANLSSENHGNTTMVSPGAVSPAPGNRAKSIGQIKKLIASPHFSFKQLAQSEANPGTLPNPQESWSGPTTRESNPPVPAQARRNLGEFVRIDEPQSSIPKTHLPQSAIESFIGWTENIINSWETFQDDAAANSLPPVMDRSTENVGRYLRVDPKVERPHDTVEVQPHSPQETLPSGSERLIVGPAQPQSENKVSPWAVESEIFQSISQFDHHLGFTSIKSRTDAQHGNANRSFSAKAELGLASAAELTQDTRPRTDRESPFVDGPNEPSISRILRQAFTTSASIEPIGVSAEAALQGSEVTESSFQASLDDDTTLIETIDRELESARRRSVIRLVPEFEWSTISDKMMGPGLPVLQKLANAIRAVTTPTHCETVVIGKSRGCGSSTVAMSLARYFAGLGEQVLLIDADTQTGGLTRLLGLTDVRSWVTLVRGSDILEKGFVCTEESGISFAPVVPLRLRTIWPPFVLDHLSNLLGTLNGVFDRVIIDGGTTNQLMSELSGNHSLATNALVVAEMGAIDEEIAQRIKSNLIGIGIEDVMIAQNFARPKLPAT